MRPFAGLLLSAIACVSAAEWKPVDGGMMTEWGERVTPDTAWAEYPRPQLRRKSWTNLNGLWKHAVTSRDAGAPAAWDGEILVPFCPESALSGVGRLIEPHEALWYERPLPDPEPGRRSLLHFEAVDHEATVWVNGEEVGRHRGGFTPFHFDITRALKPSGNTVRVRVHDGTEGFQLRGKQKLRPGGIWYTRVSGIWQTVWLETVPERSIREVGFSCDPDDGTIGVRLQLHGEPVRNERIRMRVYSDQELVGDAIDAPAQFDGAAKVRLPDPQRWSPQDPHLYEVRLELLDAGGGTIDEVTSYTALRSYGRMRDANGHWRLTLNGRPVFHWGPLDQGWWPDGLLTPPSDEAMVSDIRYLKACGFNMIRKHIKVEPRRYYHHCDRIGLMVWQDHVSAGYGPDTEPRGMNPPWTRMDPDPRDGDWPDEAHAQFVREYRRMVDTLREHPCIAVWVPFNEAWGQHRTMSVGEMARNHDPSRLINIASGGNFWPAGDIADHHNYPHPAFPLDDRRFDDSVKVVGEFGGHGLPVKGHLWREDRDNWGYGDLPEGPAEWQERFARSIDILCGLRKRGIAAGVYTQTSDVEVEINGLLTYDRVPKVTAAWVREQSERLLGTPDVVERTHLLATSEKDGAAWRYTTRRPPDDWQAGGFDDSSWREGDAGFGTAHTPGTRVRTVWETPDIWIRRSFSLDSIPPGDTLLRIHHDEDADVFLNGQRITTLRGFTVDYTELAFDRSLLRAGRNTLAIHCRQSVGGQYIDAGILLEHPR